MPKPIIEHSGQDRDLYEGIAEAIPGLLWFCNSDGLCNYGSQRYLEYTGMDSRNPGTNGGFGFAHPEDDARVQLGWRHALQSGDNHDTELRLRRHDGVYRWHRAYGVPERGSDNKIQKWVIVCIDIEEAKRVQAEAKEMHQGLVQAKQELENTVTERTHQLQQVVEQLEAFAYSIAHDMRAPLCTMHQYAELVARDFAPQIPDEAQTYLNKIMAAAKKLDTIIREVLVYTKVSQGPIVLEPMDLDRVLGEILAIHPELTQPNAELVARLAEHTVIGDDTALTQALTNLLTNAVKFIPKERKPRIEIWTEPLGERVRIYIKDNGIGVPARDCERIFQMFERLQPETEYEGSGIGLTIARRAVERMGGTLGVESMEGQGSTFWIELKKGKLC